MNLCPAVPTWRPPPSCGPSYLTARLEESAEPLFSTVVTLEEQLRGWLAEIHHSRYFQEQIAAYDRLEKLVKFFSDWEVLPFDAQAADECQRLRKQHIRIGTQDLKIAAIALVNNALLLSANLRDFRKVPGLPRGRCAHPGLRSAALARVAKIFRVARPGKRGEAWLRYSILARWKISSAKFVFTPSLLA